MLTIDELNAAASAYNRRILTGLAVSLVLGFGYLGAILPFKDAERAFFVKQFGAAPAEILVGLTPLPMVFIMFGGIWITERWAKNDTRMACPHCGKSLLHIKHVVVATRNCGHCGKRVLAEPGNAPDNAQQQNTAITVRSENIRLP